MTGKGDIRGTREWAVAEINCSRGCPHGCLYCYARYDQVEKKRIVTDSQWKQCCDLEEEVHKSHLLYDGQVMFPTAHDIIPENLESALTVIKNLLDAGNRVLIVSKPHLGCIQSICRQFYNQRDQLLFRFTITARDPAIVGLWEPGAPSYEERFMSLRSCFERGFATSVSIEPMLHREDVVDMILELLPFVSHSIWLGKMNKIKTRVVSNIVSADELQRIRAGQSNKSIRSLYAELQNVEKVRWKESMKEILGLELATKAGQDM